MTTSKCPALMLCYMVYNYDVIGQHSTMWSTCVSIQTKTSLLSLFKHDIKNEIIHKLWMRSCGCTTGSEIPYTSGHSYAVMKHHQSPPRDTTHRHRLAMHCRSITCYMYIHVFLQPLKLFNLENLYICWWIIRVNKKYHFQITLYHFITLPSSTIYVLL